MSTNCFSGARAIFRVSDKVVAFASGCDGSEEVIYEPVDVLDNIEVAEYVPVGYRVSFNCSVFRTIPGAVSNGPVGTGNGPTPPPQGTLGSVKNPAVGLFPRSQGTPSEILTNGWMSASITDRLTKVSVYKLEQVKAQSYNFSIQARGIVAQNISFNAIRAKDESSA